MKPIQGRRSRSQEEIFKAKLRKYYKYCEEDWRIRSIDDDLAMARDTIYDQYSALPRHLEFSHHSVYDRRTLSIVCKPIASYGTFAVPSFPSRPKTRLVKGETMDNCFDLDFDEVQLEYCYEGKYMRFFRYMGITRMVTRNKVSIQDAYENYISFLKLVKIHSTISPFHYSHSIESRHPKVMVAEVVYMC